MKDGVMFASSYGEEPVEFIIGNARIIPGVEKAIVGMKEGDTKTVTVSPEDGFGEYREELITAVDRSQISPDIEVEVGKTLLLRGDEGRDFSAIVTDISENEVKLDANHPLAGKELNFEIELLEVVT
jgi:peptidylprolyl isomerase